MSPEIYRNKHSFDGDAADVWTCGSILFCMVTGNQSYQCPHPSDPQFYWMTKGLTQLLGDWNVQLSHMGCRSTVFGSEAQSGVHSLREWGAAGATTFRVELVDEGPDDVELIVQGYLSVLYGEQRPITIWEDLKKVRDSNGRAGGVSYGSLRNSPVRRAVELQETT